MSNCYLCGSELTKENCTKEHIILNSIGGQLSSNNLICKECNSKLGTEVDVKLSKQLNFFSNILMINRDRGNPQPIVMDRPSTREKYCIDHNGNITKEHPNIKRNKDNVEIEARTKKEVKQILINLSNTSQYKNINVDEILKKLKPTKERINEKLHIKLKFGGKEVYPSILKTAIEYYIYKTYDILSIASAINDLKLGKTTRVTYVILKNCIFDIDENEVSHSIFILGSKKEKKLYAVIEFFNCVKFFVRLSEHYSADFEDLYVFDILERKEKKKRLNADYLLNMSLMMIVHYQNLIIPN